MKVPFIIYADFEAFTTQIHTCRPDPEKSYTMKYQHHKPSSFCFYVKCFDDSIYMLKIVMYTATSSSEDIADIFVEKLEEVGKDIYHKFKFSKKNDFHRYR